MITFNCNHSFCITCFKRYYEMKVEEGVDQNWCCFALKDNLQPCNQPSPDDREIYSDHLVLLSMLVRLFLSKCMK
jgi:hypothetical protein